MEEIRAETHEEIKSDEQRAKQKAEIENLEDEVDRMMTKMTTLRDYDWKEEMEVIHKLLLNRLNSILTAE